MDGVIVEVQRRGANDHALLAAVAGRALGVDPLELTVTHSCTHCGSREHGQPQIAGARSSVHVSLARAGQLVAVAASATSRVGIDIEALDRVAAADFDAVAFTAAERHAIDSSRDPTLLRARFWTAKEALLKASGTGLRTDPRLVELSEGPILDGAALLETFEPERGYLVTVALLAPRGPTPSRSSAR